MSDTENKTLTFLKTSKSKGKNKRRPKYFFVWPHKDDPEKLFLRDKHGNPVKESNVGAIINGMGGKEAFLIRCQTFNGGLKDFFALSQQQRSEIDTHESKKRWLEYLKSLPEPNEHQQLLIIGALISEQNALNRVPAEKKIFKKRRKRLSLP